MPNAAGLAARILEEWEHTVAAVEVVTSADGIFDVKVDDELVFTKSMLGRYPQPDDVVPLLREKLAAIGPLRRRRLRRSSTTASS